MTDLSLVEISTLGLDKDLNGNFTVLKDAVNTKADLNGSSVQKFSVADAIQTTDAINKGQLDVKVTEMNSQINDLQTALEIETSRAEHAESTITINLNNFETATQSTFDLKVDKVAGKGLSTNDLTNELKSNYDTAYSEVHTHGNKALLDNLTSSGDGTFYLADDGTYKSIGKSDCADTSLSNITPAGQLVIKNYSNNRPDYNNGVAKLINTNYIAETDGWLLCSSKVQSYLTAITLTLTLNSTAMNINGTDGDNADNSTNFICVPVSQGDTYRFASSGGSLISFDAKFYPAKGAK